MHQSIEKPLISICVPCYNHEKYIPYFMETLFRQDFQRWELVITDDCSTDNSWNLLESYAQQDARIKLYKNDRNRHLCQTLNNSFRHANGKYICIMYTDDAFVAGKLKHDFDYLENNQNISVLYNDLILIGEDNEYLNKTWKLPKDFSRYSLLHTMFMNGNCLFIPGMFFRKSCLDDVGGHNLFLCLTQDYEFHIRMLLKYEIAKSSEPYVLYRRRKNEQNLSAETCANTNFIFNEMGLLLSECVKLIPNLQEVQKIFPEISKDELVSEDDKIFYVAKVLTTSSHPAIKNTGLHLLYEFSRTHIDYLEKKYNFLPKDFMSITKSLKIYRFSSVDKGKIKNPLDYILYKVWKKIDKIMKKKGIVYF